MPGFVSNRKRFLISRDHAGERLALMLCSAVLVFVVGAAGPVFAAAAPAASSTPWAPATLPSLFQPGTPQPQATAVAPAAGQAGAASPLATPQVGSTPQAVTASPTATPVLAYYSIGYDANAWDKSDTDYPLLGKYASDDEQIMRQHVQMAKQAGIDGFIVIWKNTPKMNRRLSQLLNIANGQSFALAISYAGRDTKNKPLPLDDVGKDLDYFVRTYKGQAAFARFQKPIIIWQSATDYPVAGVQKLTASRRDRLTILASAATVKEYQPFAGALDGNAFYWSSVDPEADANYASRLVALAQAVHATRGMWIAPVAPGYSSSTGQGGREVERNDGDTLKTEYQAALASAPDAIGLISWNVFRESTQIEPSSEEGVTSLAVVADLLHGTAPKLSDFPAASQKDSANTRPAVQEFDSSEPGATQARPAGFATIGAVGLLLVASVGVVVVRSLRRR